MVTNKELESLDTETAHSIQLTSESLPHWRVYLDGTETVAIDESDTEIARGTDAKTVWQAAIDAAYEGYDPNHKETPVARIDGGGLRYNLNSSLDIKSGAWVANVEFDMSGAASTDRITVGAPTTGFTLGGGWFTHAAIFDPPQPIRFRDLVYAKLGPIYVANAVNHGAEFLGVIGCDIQINVKSAGLDGIQFKESPDTGNKGNSNRVKARANSCRTGIYNYTLRNTIFNKAISEANTSHGIVDGGEGCVWINPTTEENDSYGLYSNADRGHYIAPHSNNDTGGRFRFTGLSTECVLNGPIRGNGVISNAGTDNHIDKVAPEYFGEMIGTRTAINGVGSNGSNDPSVGGDWNGNGWEGATVYWDDGAGTNFASKYLNGGWRQVASW